jgi:hypothetical protein
VGSGELDDGQTRTRAHESLPRFAPPEGKDLRPNFVLMWVFTGSYYNGGVDWI